MAYDYATIQFDKSYRSVVSSPDVQPVGVAENTLKVDHSAYLVGYGRTGDNCEIAGDGQKRWVYLPVKTVTEDWDYRFSSPTKHSCPGDSGGPALAAIGGALQVVGVASWKDESGTSIYKSSAPGADWIKEHSGPQNLPGNTWGNCVYYTDYAQNDYYSTQTNAAAFTGTYSRFDNSISQIWVKKGFEATIYDSANYGSELSKLNGYVGQACNEFGCLHELSGTAANDRTSSATCVSALPTDTWGKCVYYDRFGNRYYSTQGNTPEFAGTYATWNNKISQVWVRRGYNARLYGAANYQDFRRTLAGTSGRACNAFGCLHELVGTTNDNVASSFECLAD
jgi:hypothetical protein